MSSIQNITTKLHQFIRKYYTNELIKGLILFFSFGMLYFLFTLFIEHFLWLKPTARTLLFWFFVAVEIYLLSIFILMPLAKLLKFKKGLSLEDASRIIGTHFSQVDDKLINLLQLQNASKKSELLLASIAQKATDIQPIPFKKAINLYANKKYLKYAIIPLLIWVYTLFTGNKSVLTQSFDRVVHYQTAYLPPAPFAFKIVNKNLEVIEGNTLTINVLTEGKTMPNDVHVVYNEQNYLLQNKDLGVFEYQFSPLQESFSFYLEANGVVSPKFDVTVIATPKISTLEMHVKYPLYTNMKDQHIVNTGNAIVPKGSKITWKVKTANTTKVSFEILDKISNSQLNNIFKKENNTFSFSKVALNDITYQIATSNMKLENYEKLQFSIKVLADEYPKIHIQTNIDSISKGPAQFAGQLNDDYGLHKLQLVYQIKNQDNTTKSFSLPIGHSTFEEFYYIFPEGLDLQQGKDYEFYFEVYDNDSFQKNKRTKSKVFRYYKKTISEEKDQLIKEQKNTINSLSKSIEKSKEAQKKLDKFQQNIQKKSDFNWNDQQKLMSFIKKHQQNQQRKQQQTQQLIKNLEQQPETKALQERKEDLKKRLEETENLEKQRALLEELKELAKKINKEELTKKIEKFSQQSKQEERSLERILELTKRFYVEQKAQQIKDKLEALAKKQEDLAKDKKNNAKKQEALNKEFKKLQKEMRDLEKQNKALKQPMKLAKTEMEETAISKDMQESKEQLENQESSESPQQNKQQAQKKQQSAAKKMKQMAGQMQQSMQQMQGEMMEENMEALRAILENLITFSYRQEDLMQVFGNTADNQPDFAKNLKKQHLLKVNFEHIDDSLYTLSMRLPKLTTKIQTDLSDAHYNLNQALEHLADDKISQGTTNQKYVMTAANNLAYELSRLLQSMQNAMQMPGQGGKGGKSFSLPDIIQQQSEMLSKCQNGSKPGKGKPGKPGKDGKSPSGSKPGGTKKGNGNGNSENQSEEIFQIYKQQAALKQALQDAMQGLKGNKSNGSKAIKQMEALEKELLEKGVTKRALEMMSQIKHELLKLKEATQEQGQEEKRESKTNNITFDKSAIKDIRKQKNYFSQDEILNRQSLPLRTLYKKKVQEYFKK